MSESKVPDDKRKAGQVVWTVDVAKCIGALTGLIHVLHKIGLF